MVIYADVLIIVNFAVDYFLLKITAVVLKLNPPFLRLILGATAAALTSLYIFLPQMNIFIDVLIKAVFCMAVTVIAFGYKSFGGFMRTFALFLAVTLCYGGVMTALWQMFSPSGMVINNSVVYFDVSPTILIISSLGFYLIITLVKTFFGKKSESAERCEITLTVGEKDFKTQGILDTGNSLTDPFGKGVAVLVNEKDVEKLFLSEEQKRLRFRAVPTKTVTGNGLLKGYRVDKLTAVKNKKTYNFKNAVAVFSNTPIAEHAAILNPNIFD